MKSIDPRTESSETSTGDGPVVILAVPRSCSSITCMMLGQHPQLYGFPELHLFSAENMDEWMDSASRASYAMDHGLLRTIAQLIWNEQTEGTIKRARIWLARRRYYTTGMMLETLFQEIHPRICIEKGPSLVQRVDAMQRAYRLFPNVRFIHLVRHPRAYCNSIMRLILEQAEHGEVSRWLLEHLYYPDVRFDAANFRRTDPLTSQHSWYALNVNVCEFLASVPPSQKLCVRGEDLLRNPEEFLARIARWLNIRTDAETITAMKHPEKSPYSSIGPLGAQVGLDPHFLQNPTFMPAQGNGNSSRSRAEADKSLAGFTSEVEELARSFGYGGE